MPGVRSAGFSSDLPWTGYDENTSFAIVGRPPSQDDDTGGRYHFVTTGYSGAAGTPLVAGRDLRDSDDANAPHVVLVNESLARKYWSAPERAVGARVRSVGTRANGGGCDR